MNIQITSKEQNLKTRITFFENMVRIDSMIFAEHAVNCDIDPCVQRKWKNKWFVKSTVYIPNGHIASLLRGFVENDSIREELTDWVDKIIEQDRRKGNTTKD